MNPITEKIKIGIISEIFVQDFYNVMFILHQPLKIQGMI